ncbi:uncharacterized protein LOC134209004 [Armigeres subalbatus]|uniref:uncharacterized protein LOC134209004 n=1 Tax=Armigeres subalbatus TaxID=124917 RepID=UPI002ED224FF
MDKLIRERKSLEPRLKRIEDVVTKLKPEDVEEIDIQSELDALSEVWSIYCIVHKKIMDATVEEDKYEETVVHQAMFEEKYISVKNRLLKIMKVVKNREISTNGQQTTSEDIIKQLAEQQAQLIRMMSTNMAAGGASTSSSIANRSAASIPLSELRLPQMNLPTFSGDYLEWQSFSDLFDSMVHQNVSLKDSQKLYFLKTNLDGEAASLISHLKIEDANYQTALEKLKSRYNKPREIANKHINRFLAQHSLTLSSAQGLRTLHDVSDEVIRALKAMGREDRDTWLLFILCEKVDPETKQLWCQKIAEMPDVDITLQCFLSFIESRSFALQSMQSSKAKTSIPLKQFAKPATRGASTYVATNVPFCELCSKQHLLYQCGTFLHMKPNDRLAYINRLKLCENCLKSHTGESCKAGMCRKCNSPHHTLLHFSTSFASSEMQANPVQTLISAIEEPSSIDASNVLLATVAINVLDHRGRPYACRAVLDSASQVNFISTSFCNKLGLKTNVTSMALEGISSTPTRSDKYTEIVISSRFTNYRTAVACLVLEKITNTLPCKPAPIHEWPIPESLHLADPLFHLPGKIDVLLGTELFFQLLEPGKMNLSADESLPILQNTKLGWIVAGRYKDQKSISTHTSTCLIVSSEDELSRRLRKFWELEQYSPPSSYLSEEEQLCEQHFVEHTTRDKSGKFVVRLPFLLDPQKLGESRQIAERRLHYIERKLDRNPELKAEYHAFMREYVALGHMSLAIGKNAANKSVYLPHHCVIKSTSTTTKCRVVFDASSKTTSGQSLNDILMCGPVIQDSLINILLRFRIPPIVLMGDAKQMYRMVWLNELNRDFLKILWRWKRDEPIMEYRLNTVTFGTKSASYLATKCVQQLLESHRQQFPVAVEKAMKGIYIDDVLTGASTEEEAKELREQLTETLLRVDFILGNGPRTVPSYWKEFRILTSR